LSGRLLKVLVMPEGKQTVSVVEDSKRVPPKYYRIGEVVEHTPFSRQTIHNYTSMGLIQEARWTRGGHRLYDSSVFETLDLIAKLKSHRKSLGFIRKHLSIMDRGKGN